MVGYILGFVTSAGVGWALCSAACSYFDFKKHAQLTRRLDRLAEIRRDLKLNMKQQAEWLKPKD
jgi:hypothetical protein